MFGSGHVGERLSLEMLGKAAPDGPPGSGPHFVSGKAVHSDQGKPFTEKPGCQ
jgi:hypothetical protein